MNRRKQAYLVAAIFGTVMTLALMLPPIAVLYAAVLNMPVSTNQGGAATMMFCLGLFGMIFAAYMWDMWSSGR